MNCVDCGKFEAYVIRSQLRLDGRRARRYECRACGNRWTTYQQTESKPREPRKLEYRPKPLGRRLTNWEAAEILMSEGMTIRQLAAKYNMSHQCIHNILIGKTYKEVYQVLYPY